MADKSPTIDINDPYKPKEVAQWRTPRIHGDAGRTLRDIDVQNGNGASCLMYVASNSKPDLVKLLLEKGANPNLRNFDDSSALDLAASLACLKLLKKAA